MKLKHIVTVGILALAFGFSPLTSKAETFVGGPVFACFKLDDLMQVINTHKGQGLAAAQDVWSQKTSEGLCGVSTFHVEAEVSLIETIQVDGKLAKLYEYSEHGTTIYFVTFVDSKGA